MSEICFPPQVAWHLSQLRPSQKQSSLQFEWWLGLTDAEKEGEFSWELDHDETLWGEVEVEAGSSPPLCGTMDANLTLRGVECTVGETETATRTILCETGGKSGNLQSILWLTGIFCEGDDRRVQPEGCRCMGMNSGELVFSSHQSTFLDSRK